jgi:integrase
MRLGYAESLPAKSKLPRAFRKRPRSFTLSDVASIIAATESYEDSVLFWCAAETGLRLGELAGLKRRSVTLCETHGFFLEVSETVWNGKSGKPKTPNALRRVAVSRRLAELLKRQLEIPERRGLEHLFCLRLEFLREYTLQPLLRKLGIKQAGFHAFRHFNASLMDVLRIPLKTRQERLGHASTGSLTLDVYTHA